MKTMTCRQMGGPCDMAFQAETADEMMGLGAQHVNDMAGKDTDHKAAYDMMEEGRKNPEAGKMWYEKFLTDFAAVSEN